MALPCTVDSKPLEPTKTPHPSKAFQDMAGGVGKPLEVPKPLPPPTNLDLANLTLLRVLWGLSKVRGLGPQDRSKIRKWRNALREELQTRFPSEISELFEE